MKFRTIRYTPAPKFLGFDRCGIAFRRRPLEESVADCWSDGSHRDGTAA
ncbi:MAG: hypothetical protein ACLR8Y_13020 [Alistipes indistinctus]